MIDASDIILDANKAGAARCSWKRKGALAFFVKEFWDIIVPNPLEWNWHMDVLCDEIQSADSLVFQRLPKKHDLVINVPPGTSKTKIISILSTCWEFSQMPSIKVFVGSYSDSAIMGIADEIRIVMTSTKYREWFPDTNIRSNKKALHNFKTTVNGEFYAFTVGGTLTSKHADILKVDDPLNPKQAASEAELEAANHFFRKTLPTRKVDKKVTPTYLIMQRLAVNDPSGMMLERKGEKIRHICLPGEIISGYKSNVKPAHLVDNYVGGLLDPGRLDKSALDELNIDLGSDGYAGQVGQTPVPEGGLVWKEQWFHVIPDYDFPDPKWAGVTDYANDWDLAYTEKDKNSASAHVTSFEYKRAIYIDNIGWNWYEFPALIKWMKTMPGYHYIEKKASGKSAKQTLSAGGLVAVEVDATTDKLARARMATPVAESGIVYIRKSIADRFFNDVRQGIKFFPKGTYGDLADALSQMLTRRRKGGTHVMGDNSEDQADYDLLDELDY